MCLSPALRSHLAQSFREREKPLAPRLGASTTAFRMFYDSYERANAQDVPDESQASTGKGKSAYEKMGENRKRLLIDLWVKHADILERKESRKTWCLIVECNKTVKKCMQKNKNIVNKYKKAKGWNDKQTGGNVKKSIYYDKIDSVVQVFSLIWYRKRLVPSFYQNFRF